LELFGPVAKMRESFLIILKFVYRSNNPSFFSVSGLLRQSNGLDIQSDRLRSDTFLVSGALTPPRNLRLTKSSPVPAPVLKARGEQGGFPATAPNDANFRFDNN
jgi:hypothetical protein